MTYETLSSRLQAWTADDDTGFTGSIADIITLGELRVARELNCDAMRSVVTGTIAAGDTTIARASDVVAIRFIEITVSATQRRMLLLRQDSWIRDRFPDPTFTGTPELYGYQDKDTILIGPKSDASYDYSSLVEKRVVGVAPGTDTWLSLRHDDLLFYSAQLESNVFEKDSDSAKQVMAMYERALAKAQEEIVRGRMDANSVNR